jgi:nucleoside-diphosphate-sugar epimerase
MKVLITGGAGFIGRAAVKKFLAEGHSVLAFDDLSNGSKFNLREFSDSPNFEGLKIGNISDIRTVEKTFEDDFDLCLHLAAQINVQESLDDPDFDFTVNVIGTHNILSQALKKRIKTVIMGTCMVYDVADVDSPIGEDHPVLPRSPYAASKLTAENLALSYYYGLNLPVMVLRPFNVYGPYQKSNTEGGVVSVFIDRNIKGKDLEVYGDGTQTRDLLFVDDCAEFIYTASESEAAVGEIINAGTGSDITINDLALMIARDEGRIKHTKHIHPQSEIKKLLCDYSKAKRLLGWEPKFTLEDGIKVTEEWLSQNQNPP